MSASYDPINEPGRTRYGSGSGQGEMGRFFADVEDLLKRVTNMNDADVARLRERVEGSLSTARDTLSRGATRVRESAGDMADTTDSYVRSRPWTVVGLAMVAGLVLGAVLLSSSDRR